MSSGPLDGTRIIEVAGIGPGPFAAMMLADMGADVIRIDRSTNVFGGNPAAPPADVLNRGRRSIAIDLKSPEGAETVLRLVEHADAFIEGFRPGVAERLGFGPDVCLDRNPRLVYGRMTGWGQDGPYAHAAGHDINYIALGGVLAHLGRAEQPTAPINLVGDFGGGGMLMAYGVVCGLLSAGRTGEGQVIDAAMIDGSSSLMTMMWAFSHMGIWDEQRGVNILDTGSHFYDTYETADGKWVAIGAIEPQFYAELLRLSGLAERGDLPPQMDKSRWEEAKKIVAEVFRSKTQAQWNEILEGSDACYAPVLTMSEAMAHPHNVARHSFIEVAGLAQPAPAPRFSKTPGAVSRPPSHAGQHTDEILGEWLGFDADAVAKLRAGGAVA
ncbi:MAG: CoA transferase [Microthrixaceae bacterium]|nr:CoA transferase [Microthrixaceae bacterium]